MSLHAQVARLDDYTGGLEQELAKLEMERSRGALSIDEEMDFLEDLRTAARERILRPPRRRAGAWLVAGLAMGVAAGLLPAGFPWRREAVSGLVVAAAGGAAAAVGWLTVFLRRRRRIEAWLRNLEGAVKSGGTIFDVP